MSPEEEIDRLLREVYFPDPGYKGTLVEVGAARPDFLSIGASFRKDGWTVVSIEPNPKFVQLWRAANIEVLEYACGDHNADDVPFYVVNSLEGRYAEEAVTYESFSSLGIDGKYKDLQGEVRTETTRISVKLRRLDTILEQHHPGLRGIDILSVDVEGWELSVLKGLSFERHEPKVLIIENLFKDPAYNAFIETLGYEFCGQIGPNEIYLRPEVAAA